MEDANVTLEVRLPLKLLGPEGAPELLELDEPPELVVPLEEPLELDELELVVLLELDDEVLPEDVPPEELDELLDGVPLELLEVLPPVEPLELGDPPVLDVLLELVAPLELDELLEEFELLLELLEEPPEPLWAAVKNNSGSPILIDVS